MSAISPKQLFFLFLFSSVILTGCLSTLDITPKEVEEKINLSLTPGDDAGKIEAYFKNEGLGLSYDKFQNRYQSIIRHPDSNFHAITIYVYVDESKKIVRVEANDSYTFL